MIILVLETMPQARTARHPRYLAYTEDASNTLGRSLFTWINPILMRGYRGILTHYDLLSLSNTLDVGPWRKHMLRA
ncbi:hypothetical protein F5Y01DRAFT_287980 [Xylaria sp. FL0043]|nr:hypothetical protein F5Y01DRAFT_287980 [Xylaria sp. FL0043]